MPLQAGTRLASYEIVAPLGAGGMGEVYRARDTQLKREVALKVLPEGFSQDPDRLARFQREAELLATLNHPNIAAVYGLEKSDGVTAIVLELVEGETLAERIEGLRAKGIGLPLDEALPIARQIADALEAAHEKGVIHRDLKPANIKITPDGKVKVLDFGLAKALDDPHVGRPFRGADLANSPTLTRPAAMTGVGVILGTAAYMSPEQTRGRVVDKRTDVWAFGCVLYEMLAGRRAFDGEDATEILAAIVKSEPDWKALPSDVPDQIQLLLKRCLEKDRGTRVSDIGVARFLMTESITLPPAPVIAAPLSVLTAHRRVLAIGVVAGIALAAIAAWAVARLVPSAAEAIEFTIQAPENSVFAGQVPTFAVSPDGRHVVFVATTLGAPMLFLRSLGALAVKPLPGTEQATFPFWSPDSRFVAFFASGKLKKVRLTAGGPPSVVCDAASGRGGTWNGDNVIVFAPSTSGGLERVAAAGGAPAPATTVDTAHGETTHRWPHFLPDGRHFMYLAPTSGQRPSEVRVASLDSKDTALVVAAESAAAYASGHLFFWRDGGVVAQPFDAGTRQVKGDPLLVAQQVGQNVGYTSFSVSPTGVLVYARGSVRPTSQLTWVDRAGKTLGTAGEPGEYFNIALAPDERRVAVTLQTGTPENRDIWLIDLARSVSSRLTSDPAIDVLPAWSPDGARIAFSSTRAASGMYLKASSGSGQEELLMKAAEGTANVTDWSRDGRFIIYFGTYPKTGFDLWILPLAGDRKPIPFLQTAFNEDNGAFAPDVKWIAYTSNESGRDEVYVQPFPATGGRYQISRSGGTQPMWRGDGRELFFLTPDGTMMAASIDATHGFEAGIAQPLFASGVASTVNRRQYAVTKDGQRFLVIVAQQRSNPAPLTVVVNWQAAVQK